MPGPGYFVPQRNTNKIVVYLSSKHPTPPVPFELQGTIAPDVWATRLPTISKTAERYSKPIFERVWLATGIIAMFVVPIAVYSSILSALHVQKDIDGFTPPADLVEARAISSAISFGIILLFAVPLIVWKIIGRQHVNHLLRQWATSDNRIIGNNGPIPTWKVQTPGIFSDNTILTVIVPLSSSPSAFHWNAYLPPYVNPPTDADATYFYLYKPEPGLPRMSVVGNVPIYMDEKRGFDSLTVAA